MPGNFSLVPGFVHWLVVGFSCTPLKNVGLCYGIQLNYLHIGLNILNLTFKLCFGK
jgi:hypothetical protein